MTPPTETSAITPTTTTTPPQSQSPQPRPTRKQREHLAGQVTAVCIVASEVRRELRGLPSSSLNYFMTSPSDRSHENDDTDVLLDAKKLWQAANNLLRSIGYIAVEEDQDEIPAPSTDRNGG